MKTFTQSGGEISGCIAPMDMMAAQMLKHARLKAFSISCTCLLPKLLQKGKPKLFEVHTLQVQS